MATIFKLVSKEVQGLSYAVTGVSARLNSCDIGDQLSYIFSFSFYAQDELGNYIFKHISDIPVKSYLYTPEDSSTSVVSLLLSPKKIDNYKAALFLCGLYNYQLLPIYQQDIPDIIS